MSNLFDTQIKTTLYSNLPYPLPNPHQRDKRRGEGPLLAERLSRSMALILLSVSLARLSRYAGFSLDFVQDHLSSQMTLRMIA